VGQKNTRVSGACAFMVILCLNLICWRESLSTTETKKDHTKRVHPANYLHKISVLRRLLCVDHLQLEFISGKRGIVRWKHPRIPLQNLGVITHQSSPLSVSNRNQPVCVQCIGLSCVLSCVICSMLVSISCFSCTTVHFNSRSSFCGLPGRSQGMRISR
jgi:hypothetical protein